MIPSRKRLTLPFQAQEYVSSSHMYVEWKFNVSKALHLPLCFSTTRPPNLFAFEILLHLTRCIFLFSSLSSYRNCNWVLSNLFATVEGILIIDRGRVLRVDLIKVSLPPINRNLFFHCDNFFWPLSMTGFQVRILLRLYSKVYPRHFIGMDSTLHTRILVTLPFDPHWYQHHTTDTC